MEMTPVEILDVILHHVKELEGDSISHITLENFGEMKLNSLKMDSLSLLELGMAVSTDIGSEVDFLELDAGSTMQDIANHFASASD